MPSFDFIRGSHQTATPLLLATFLTLAVLAFVAAMALSKKPKATLSHAEFDALYSEPLPLRDDPQRVYHLGHSLVGRDLPAMVQQLSGPGHGYDVQLGWGTPLKVHWEKGLEINGFSEENAHDRYRDARDALTSGDYDAFVATEMVEIRDAIAHHASGRYMRQWAELARQGNPDIRVYLYETWPRIDDPEGWLTRLDLDLERYWEAGVLIPALDASASHQPVYVIPVGQVFARFVRAVEARGGVDNVTEKRALFRKNAIGSTDPIHLNDLGVYLAALTHYAVLYHKTPVGLPWKLRRADGSLADAPGEQAARLMQEVVWQVVTNYPKTGVPQADAR